MTREQIVWFAILVWNPSTGKTRGKRRKKGKSDSKKFREQRGREIEKNGARWGEMGDGRGEDMEYKRKSR